MSVFSFSFMPRAVLERILEHATERSHATLSSTDIHPDGKERSLAPLLSVCHQWREVAVPILFQQALLSVYKHHESIAKDRHSVGDITRIIDLGYERLVKVMFMRLGKDYVILEAATSILAGLRASGTAFPAVTQLAVEFGRFWSWDEHASAIDAKTGEFCDLVDVMFPNIKKATFSFPMYLGSLEVEAISKVVARLSSGAQTLAIFGWIDYTYEPQPPPPITWLKHISVDCRGELVSSSVFELVRINARTLVSVKLAGVYTPSCIHLVQDSEGNAVVYPHVCRLEITTMRTVLRDPPSPLGAPFPALVHLMCKTQYPFKNDVLFRGNRDTLETIDIHITEETASLLKCSGLFDPGSLPNVRSVAFTIGKPVPIYRGETENQDELIDMVLKAPQSVEHLKLETYHAAWNGSINRLVQLSRFASCLRVLDVARNCLTVAQVAELLKLLPALNKLAFEIHTDEETPGPFGESTIGGFIAEHSPASTRLSTLQVQCAFCPVSEDIQEQLLVLACTLPSLRRITIEYTEPSYNPFDTTYKITKPELLPYLDHLNSLSFIYNERF